MAPDAVEVSIPEDKICNLRDQITSLLESPVGPIREYRRLAGKLAFVAGLVPVLRPFVAPLWAVCYGAPGQVMPKGSRQAPQGGDSRRT